MVIILALTVAATAIASTIGAHFIWILTLLWFDGPCQRHRPRITTHHRDLALLPVEREGSRT